MRCSKNRIQIQSLSAWLLLVPTLAFHAVIDIETPSDLELATAAQFDASGILFPNASRLNSGAVGRCLNELESQPHSGLVRTNSCRLPAWPIGRLEILGDFRGSRSRSMISLVHGRFTWQHPR